MIISLCFNASNLRPHSRDDKFRYKYWFNNVAVACCTVLFNNNEEQEEESIEVKIKLVSRMYVI
jgi:hypothetical protein